MAEPDNAIWMLALLGSFVAICSVPENVPEVVGAKVIVSAVLSPGAMVTVEEATEKGASVDRFDKTRLALPTLRSVTDKVWASPTECSPQDSVDCAKTMPGCDGCTLMGL